MHPTSLPPEGAVPRLVWDAPVRVFHWLFAASFVTAWLTAESDAWLPVHVTAGYTMAGLLVFRIAWGFLGTRHARFRDFVRGPRAVAAYLRSLARRKPEHHAGHNPAGALAILALLGLGAATAFTGWASLQAWGGHAMEELHEGLASAMLALAIIHVFAVLASSRLHRENLVASMLHGRRTVPAREGIRHARRGLAVLLLAAVLGFWWEQWQHPPALAQASAERHHDDDDD